MGIGASPFFRAKWFTDGLLGICTTRRWKLMEMVRGETTNYLDVSENSTPSKSHGLSSFFPKVALQGYAPFSDTPGKLLTVTTVTTVTTTIFGTREVLPIDCSGSESHQIFMDLRDDLTQHTWNYLDIEWWLDMAEVRGQAPEDHRWHGASDSGYEGWEEDEGRDHHLCHGDCHFFIVDIPTFGLEQNIQEVQHVVHI